MTTRTAHTPGPWEAIINPNDDGKGVPDFALANSQEKFAVLLYKPGTYHPDGWKGFRKEATANAHLIAAAPALLEALKAIIAPVGTEVWIREIAEEAIAQAEGR